MPSKVGFLLSEELLKELDKMFPDRCPNPKDSKRQLWMKAGNREVVEILRAKFNEANENILNVPE